MNTDIYFLPAQVPVISNYQKLRRKENHTDSNMELIKKEKKSDVIASTVTGGPDARIRQQKPCMEK